MAVYLHSTFLQCTTMCLNMMNVRHMKGVTIQQSRVPRLRHEGQFQISSTARFISPSLLVTLHCGRWAGSSCLAQVVICVFQQPAYFRSKGAHVLAACYSRMMDEWSSCSRVAERWHRDLYLVSPSNIFWVPLSPVSCSPLSLLHNSFEIHVENLNRHSRLGHGCSPIGPWPLALRSLTTAHSPPWNGFSDHDLCNTWFFHDTL